MNLDGQWLLCALRQSAPGDPVDASTAGISRFCLLVGDEAEIMEYYNKYAQPNTGMILAEVRNPQRQVVALFDRVAEAVMNRTEQTAEALSAIADAALGRSQ